MGGSIQISIISIPMLVPLFREMVTFFYFLLLICVQVTIFSFISCTGHDFRTLPFHELPWHWAALGDATMGKRNTAMGKIYATTGKLNATRRRQQQDRPPHAVSVARNNYSNYRLQYIASPKVTELISIYRALSPCIDYHYRPTRESKIWLFSCRMLNYVLWSRNMLPIKIH